MTSYDDLAEVQAYIGQCRRVIPDAGSVEVFDNTDLNDKPNNRIATINAGTATMRLTGVLREASGDNTRTAAQVFLPTGRLSTQQPVGWVDASKITTCSSPQ